RQAFSDEHGRFRLEGLPLGRPIELLVMPETMPYLPAKYTVTVPAERSAVSIQCRLRRGAWVRGKVSDLRTGKPVSGYVQYYAFKSNPHLEGLDDFADAIKRVY